MLQHEPADAVAHRLDARGKLLFQMAFVAAAFAHTTPRGLAALTVVAGGCLAAARLSPVAALRSVWPFLPFLVFAPAFETVRLGPPWVVPADAVGPALASYRILLVVLVGLAYVRSTPVRDSRAAIQWLVPGRTGQLLGMGVAFVFRFIPLLRADVARVRRAQSARLGTERSASDRVRLLVVRSLVGAFRRADRFALALQARCFAWNPTLPEQRFRRGDWIALLVAAALLAWATAPAFQGVAS
jgi:biotin transport system permease protein